MQVYIVYMGDKPKADASITLTHHSMLQTVLGRSLQTAISKALAFISGYTSTPDACIDAAALLY